MVYVGPISNGGMSSFAPASQAELSEEDLRQMEILRFLKGAEVGGQQPSDIQQYYTPSQVQPARATSQALLDAYTPSVGDTAGGGVPAGLLTDGPHVGGGQLEGPGGYATLDALLRGDWKGAGKGILGWGLGLHQPAQIAAKRASDERNLMAAERARLEEKERIRQAEMNARQLQTLTGVEPPDGVSQAGLPSDAVPQDGFLPDTMSQEVVPPLTLPSGVIGGVQGSPALRDLGAPGFDELTPAREPITLPTQVAPLDAPVGVPGVPGVPGALDAPVGVPGVPGVPAPLDAPVGVPGVPGVPAPLDAPVGVPTAGLGVLPTPVDDEQGGWLDLLDPRQQNIAKAMLDGGDINGAYEYAKKILDPEIHTVPQGAGVWRGAQHLGTQTGQATYGDAIDYANLIADSEGYERGSPEWKQSVIDYQRAARQGPQAEINIGDLSGNLSQQVIKDLDAADMQRAIADDSRIMLSMLDQGLQTNAWAPFIASAAAYLKPLGIEISKDLPYAQAFRAVSNMAALRLRNPRSGMGLTGNTSDTDLKFLRESVARLGTVRQANYMILNISIAKAERQADISELRAHYISTNNSVRGYTDFRDEWIKNNSIFTPESVQRIEQMLQEPPMEGEEVLDRSSGGEWEWLDEAPTNVPTTAGPPTNGPPTAGPPTNGPPTAGPPTNGPPTAGPPREWTDEQLRRALEL